MSPTTKNLQQRLTWHPHCRTFLCSHFFKKILSEHGEDQAADGKEAWGFTDPWLRSSPCKATDERIWWSQLNCDLEEIWWSFHTITWVCWCRMENSQLYFITNNLVRQRCAKRKHEFMSANCDGNLAILMDMFAIDADQYISFLYL